MNEKKILVVDDDEFVRDAFEQAFNKAEYMIRSAESGEEALEILKDEKIQVMFLDLNMPGMNGVDLCKEIRKDTSIAIIYAVTGYSSLFEPSDCRDAGFDDYFHKPVDLKSLLNATQDAFEKIDRRKMR